MKHSTGPDLGKVPIPDFLTLEGGQIFRDGAGPNLTPIPTALPTISTQARTANEIFEREHPDGLPGCQAYNVFSAGSGEVHYTPWCLEQLLEGLKDQCRGAGNTAADLACADTYLTNWNSHHYRMTFRCFAISDTEELVECSERGHQTLDETTSAFRQAYSGIQDVVKENAEVKTAYSRVLSCLSNQSFTNLQDKLLFHWQDSHRYLGDTGASREWTASFSEAEATKRRELDIPSNTCAVKEGLYTAQETAWLAELQRRVDADDSNANTLVTWGLLDALEAEGAAPFLTLRR